MKTNGPVLWLHMVPWLLRHLTDAERQRYQKAGQLSARTQRKLRRAFGFACRKVAKKKKHEASSNSKDAREVAVDPENTKFHHWGLGVVICRHELEGPTLNGKPLVEWRKHRVGDFAAIEAWRNQLGDWHSGYRPRQKPADKKTSAAGTGDDHKGPVFFPDGSDGRPDRRFFQVTLTTPPWDSEALGSAMKAGEVSAADADELLDSIVTLYDDGRFAKLISNGAATPLQLSAIIIHPQDGTLHIHPVFLHSARLAFDNGDGYLFPRSKSPKGGRRRPGREWIGGERLGLISPNKGWLVTNPLSSALCAADAWKAEGLVPPVGLGSDWGFLEFAIKNRQEGAVDEDGHVDTTRLRGAALGIPYDLWGTRELRALLKAFAATRENLNRRREMAIIQARLRAEQDNQTLVEAVAGAEIAEQTKLFGPLLGGIEKALQLATTHDVMPNQSEWYSRLDGQIGYYGLSKTLRRQIDTLARSGPYATKAKAVARSDDGLKRPLLDRAELETILAGLAGSQTNVSSGPAKTTAVTPDVRERIVATLRRKLLTAEGTLAAACLERLDDLDRVARLKQAKSAPAEPGQSLSGNLSTQPEL